jgi:hypothetical protein
MRTSRGKEKSRYKRKRTNDLEKVTELIENKVKTSVSQMEGVTDLNNIGVESLARAIL